MELEPLTLFEIIIVIFLLFVINLDLISVEKNKSVGDDLYKYCRLQATTVNIQSSDLEKFLLPKIGA